MHFSEAMQLDVATALSRKVLDEARLALGARKLEFRQSLPQHAWGRVCRGLNAKIDEINREDDKRQRDRRA